MNIGASCGCIVAVNFFHFLSFFFPRSLRERLHWKTTVLELSRIKCNSCPGPFSVTRTCLERRSQSEIININDLNSLTQEPSNRCAILIRSCYRLLFCSVSQVYISFIEIHWFSIHVMNVKISLKLNRTLR